MKWKANSVLPGFGISLGFVLIYLSLIVLIPLGFAIFKSAELSFSDFWQIVASKRALSAYRLSFGSSFVAASINALCGLAVAWSLVRYKFPGRKLMDALIDLPFALPTSVAGIALTAIYSKNGWIGNFAERLGFRIAFTPIGVTLALIFISLPFSIRTVQPVIADLDADAEQAAASLGASRLQTFRMVIFPAIWPAVLTGFALAFARSIGEYGSVIFISGNMPMKTEIAPLLIVTKLEQYDYAGATAIAVAMLTVSFILLLLINLLQNWSRKRSF